MILIISDEKDISTNQVISWLLYRKIKFIRINTNDKLSLKKVEITNGVISNIILIKNDITEFNINNIESYWYRRGSVQLEPPSVLAVSDLKLQYKLTNYLYRDNTIVEEYINHTLGKIPHIGRFETKSVNKLVSLEIAKSLGLKIPNTLIFSTKYDVEKLNYSNLIVKSISDSFIYYDENGAFMTYTEDIILENIPDNFRMTKFQTKVEKEADIRIFYLMGDFYVMAIKSQNNKQTSTDFRKYDHKNPNRCVPFSLPIDIKNKIISLMQAMGLETGSLDFILTKEGEFVFLEINPIGQFGMTSIPCNFYLERIITLLYNIFFFSIKF